MLPVFHIKYFNLVALLRAKSAWGGNKEQLNRLGEKVQELQGDTYTKGKNPTFPSASSIKQKKGEGFESGHRKCLV